MDSLGFSLGFDDDETGDESALEQRAEESLRSHHLKSRPFGSTSSNGSETPLERSQDGAGSSWIRARSNHRPAVKSPTASNKPKAPKKPAPKRTRTVEHSVFAPPPIATKGAYRLGATSSNLEDDERGDALCEALASMGISRRSDRDSVREMAPMVVADASEASVSFSRHFAVDVAEMYGAGVCPICEESSTFNFQLAKTKTVNNARAASKQTGPQQRVKDRFMRAMQQRASLAEEDQRLHEVIYAVEHSLCGRIGDERIFRLVLLLRRSFVEKNLERSKIEYVPWTLAMLQEHFEPGNDHIWRPVRNAKKRYRMAEEMLEHMFAATTAAGSYDFRAANAFNKTYDTLIKGQKEIDDMLDLADANIAESLRLLSVAIFKTTCDEATFKLTHDPETAAGKIAPSGDNRTTAGTNERNEPNGQYAMTHISAQ